MKQVLTIIMLFVATSMVAQNNTPEPVSVYYPKQQALRPIVNVSTPQPSVYFVQHENEALPQPIFNNANPSLPPVQSFPIPAYENNGLTWISLITFALVTGIIGWLWGFFFGRRSIGNNFFENTSSLHSTSKVIRDTANDDKK